MASSAEVLREHSHSIRSRILIPVSLFLVTSKYWESLLLNRGTVINVFAYICSHVELNFGGMAPKGKITAATFEVRYGKLVAEKFAQYTTARTLRVALAAQQSYIPPYIPAISAHCDGMLYRCTYGISSYVSMLML